MLDQIKRDYFLQQIAAATISLDHYKADTWLYNLEAYSTLEQLKKALEKKPVNPDLLNELQSILKARWSTIANTNIEYLHDFTNPANKLCIELAKELEPLLRTPYLIILMPNLAEISEADYITSSYHDKMDLHDLVLSYRGNRIISISDVLSSAQEDGILKHNSLFNGQAKALSDFEIKKVLSRHSTVKEFYDALESRAYFKLHGDTVGAALNRLISGLRDGGYTKGKVLNTKSSGSDFNSGYDANTAIVEFSEYLETLSPEILNMLMHAEVINYYSKKDIILSDVWGRLARPQEAEYKQAIYCVELIANDLQKILDANSWLFDLISYEGGAVESLAALEESVVKSRDAMTSELKFIEKHSFYDSKKNRALSLALYKLLPDFILRTQDIAFIADNYVLNMVSNALIESIAKTHSPSIIMSAMSLMSLDGKRKFIEISGFKEPRPEVRFFAPEAPEEPKSTDKRRADKAGMAPNIMASNGEKIGARIDSQLSGSRTVSR